MDNNFFKPAGDLGVSNDNNPLRPAGDLGVLNGNNPLRPAGNLGVSNGNNSFMFERQNNVLKTPDEIREWLKTVVSGKKMSSENRPAIGGGRVMVTLDELKKMVDNGDNIIKAEYIEGVCCVNVEFESFSIPSRCR